MGFCDRQCVGEEEVGRFMESSTRRVCGCHQAVTDEVETPDVGGGASEVATDAALQPGQDTQSEEPVKDSDAGAGGCTLGGVLSEEHAPQVGGGGIAVLIDEAEDLPVARTEPLRYLCDVGFTCPFHIRSAFLPVLLIDRNKT